jgi:hypothetical protein
LVDLVRQPQHGVGSPELKGSTARIDQGDWLEELIAGELDSQPPLLEGESGRGREVANLVPGSVLPPNERRDFQDQVELLPIQLGQEVPCIRRFERELQFNLQYGW